MQTPSNNQIQRIADLTRIFRRKHPDRSEDEINQMARQQSLDRSLFASGRHQQIAEAKIFLRENAEQSVDVFNLDDLREHLTAKGLTRAGANNGIGDLVGRKGLYLEWTKIAGKKHYKVPSLDLCIDWYEGKERFLPSAYYTPLFLEDLLMAESGHKDRSFYEHFQGLLESQEVSHDE